MRSTSQAGVRVWRSAARPESADSRSAWGLDGDDADVSTFNGQKSTGIDIQSGGGGGGPAMVTSHQALGIRDTWLNKLGRGVRCTYTLQRLVTVDVKTFK